jgi:hypothetical protein
MLCCFGLASLMVFFPTSRLLLPGDPGKRDVGVDAGFVIGCVRRAFSFLRKAPGLLKAFLVISFRVLIIVVLVRGAPPCGGIRPVEGVGLSFPVLAALDARAFLAVLSSLSSLVFARLKGLFAPVARGAAAFAFSLIALPRFGVGGLFAPVLLGFSFVARLVLRFVVVDAVGPSVA